MSEYRIDQLNPQQPIIYLHNIASVSANADVIFFIGYDGAVKATCPVAANVAYVQI